MNSESHVVLKGLQISFGSDIANADDVINEIKKNSSNLDSIEAKLARLGHPVPEGSKLHLVRNIGHKNTGENSIDWGTFLKESRQIVASRGFDPEKISSSDLLSREEILNIEKRFSGGFRLQANLDQYDIAAMAIAGIVAALVDFFIVRIPKDMAFHGEFQEGSPLTKWMKSFDVPSDNTLAAYFKASFDKVKDVEIDGFSGRSHRLQTFAHDPLMGLVIGTMDVMRGGLTGVSRDGVIHYISDTGVPVNNPLKALVIVIGHLLSDVCTKMGIPVPGWSVTHMLQFGEFGTKGRNLSEVARFMYLEGYDSRHFLTMATSVAAAEIVLRSYVGLRKHFDEDYGAVWSRQERVGNIAGISANPRFQAMSLGAHGIAAAANAGKIAFQAGNPLAFNYAQWLRFSQQLFGWLQTRLVSPSKVISAYVLVNEQTLLEGWPAIDTSEEGFPVLA